MVVEGWLARAAAARPAHPALITPAGIWSYAQLLAAADAGAQELAHAGVQAGARVAIALPGGLAFAQALHACMLLGAVAVPVDTRLTPRERAQVSAGSTQVIAEPLPPAPPRSGLRRPRRARTRAQRPPGARAHALDATAVVLHTSGTSSAPRAVELTYGNFLWSALGSAAALALDLRSSARACASAPRLGSRPAAGRRARSRSRARPSRRPPRRPTGGCAAATSAGWTSAGACTSQGAPRS